MVNSQCSIAGQNPAVMSWVIFYRRSKSGIGTQLTSSSIEMVIDIVHTYIHIVGFYLINQSNFLTWNNQQTATSGIM